MENPIPRPLGLAALITATVTLLSPGVMGPAGQWGNQTAIAPSTPNGIALSTHTFSPSIATAMGSNGATPPPTDPRQSLAHGLRSSQEMLDHLVIFNRQRQLQAQKDPDLPKDLPADIRSARLMLSVESLFKATTAN